MTQKSIKIFVHEDYSTSLKKNYSTNKSDFYHNDEIWSLDIIDLQVYGPEKNRNDRYVLVVMANFSNFVLQSVSKIKLLEQ